MNTRVEKNCPGRNLLGTCESSFYKRYIQDSFWWYFSLCWIFLVSEVIFSCYFSELQGCMTCFNCLCLWLLLAMTAFSCDAWERNEIFSSRPLTRSRTLAFCDLTPTQITFLWKICFIFLKPPWKQWLELEGWELEGLCLTFLPHPHFLDD